MPGKLRAPKDAAWAAAMPLDQTWIGLNLLVHETQCEARGCEHQAVWAYEGTCAIAYLCAEHRDLLLAQPQLGRHIEAWLWELFNISFNFIYQNNVSGGALLDALDERDEVAAALAKAAKVQVHRQLTAAVGEVKAARKAMMKEIKPGMPDSAGPAPAIQFAPAGIMPIGLLPVTMGQEAIDSIERGHEPVLMLGLLA